MEGHVQSAKGKMTTIQESQSSERYHLLLKVEEIHLEIIKSENMTIIPN